MEEGVALAKQLVLKFAKVKVYDEKKYITRDYFDSIMQYNRADYYHGKEKIASDQPLPNSKLLVKSQAFLRALVLNKKTRHLPLKTKRQMLMQVLPQQPKVSL